MPRCPTPRPPRATTTIAPVAILRPGADGNLHHVATVQPSTTRRARDWESDITRYRYVVIAVTETGEECHVGRFATRGEALDAKYAWLESHPEHRDCLVESI